MGCANLKEVSYCLYTFQVVSVSVLTAVVVSRLCELIAILTVL